MNLHHERMSEAFEKWHVYGLPIGAAFHHFTAPDLGDPHDHPWGFTSHVLAGGYVEEVFTVTPTGWTSELHHRQPGTSHTVLATHIHRIVELPAGECWTLVTPGPAERETRFWRFGERIESRAWHEEFGA
ncbi:hypothetical protein [Sphingomonas sp. PB4P5]|uniref:hypothetical protein n=1 Tax=Parasphingomonas puruogangriensis TaxID=3096155 RepID=UPI002FC8FFE5